jgi:hypothetical protein
MVYDRGRSHSSPGYNSPKRTYSAPETEQEKAEREYKEQQQQQQKQLEQTAIKSSLLLPDKAEKLVIEGFATEQQVWLEFLQEVGSQFDAEVAMIVGATISDGVLPIGDLVAAGITLAIAVEIYSKWDSLWQEAASGIVTTHEPENQIYNTPTDSEVETQRHTGHGDQPEVETGTPGFETEQVETSRHTGHAPQERQTAQDFVMKSKQENSDSDLWKIPNEAENKIPDEWVKEPNKKARKGKEGFRWKDPNNKGNGIRIDRGDPNHRFTSQQVDHVIVNNDGKVIGRNGQPIKGSIKNDPDNAHIPLSEWQNWQNWYSP